MPLKSEQEIQRVHDLLAGIVLGDSPLLLNPEILTGLHSSTDVLCWVLKHDHNQTFATNLQQIEAMLRAEGVVIVDAQENPSEVSEAAPFTPSHFVSQTCAGERCRICRAPATHKLGEEIPHDDPSYQAGWQQRGLSGPTGNPLLDMGGVGRHNLTAYVCCRHFALVVGPAAPCFQKDVPFEDGSPESLLLNACFAMRRFLDNRHRAKRPQEEGQEVARARWEAVEFLYMEADFWAMKALEALGIDSVRDPRLTIDPDRTLFDDTVDERGSLYSLLSDLYGGSVAEQALKSLREEAYPVEPAEPAEPAEPVETGTGSEATHA